MQTQAHKVVTPKSVINNNQKMNSEFDVTVSFLQNVYKQASLDSQKLQSQMKHLHDQLQQLQKNIDNKNDGILRQMTPRIQQLQQKIKYSWGSIEAMDKLSWEQLDKEKQIFLSCQQIVKEMDSKIDAVISRL